MAYATTEYVIRGDELVFSFSFPYIHTEHLQVTADGNPVDFTIIGSNLIQLTETLPVATVMVIKRVTPLTKALVDFANGARLGESNLDLMSLQLLYVTQEAYDAMTALSSEELLGEVLGLRDQCEEFRDEVVETDARYKSMDYNVAHCPAEEEPSAYYDESTNTLYMSLHQGPQGIQGPQGLQGPQGTQGPEGPRGLVGPQGIQGTAGLQGPMGPQGITGETGARGPEGKQGVEGPMGPQGIQGPEGDRGPQGTAGPIGAIGPQGPMGDTSLGLAFGHFRLDANGCLYCDYYGEASDHDFTINANGELEVTI